MSYLNLVMSSYNNSNSYEALYHKYKSKYLKFKVHGGSIGVIKQYYLPCEIDNISTGLFYNDHIQTEYKELIDEITVDKFNILEYYTAPSKYAQDFGLLLLNIEQGEKGMAIVKDIQRNENDFIIKNNCEVVKKLIDGANDYGGNFISSPKNGINYGYIYCFNNINPLLETYIKNNCVQDLVKLECSFRFEEIRHIDECMCFMPYANNKFKVWIYHINDIKINEPPATGMQPDETNDIIKDTLATLRANDGEYILNLIRTFNDEKSTNKTLIQDSLKNYINFDGFVEFPINLVIHITNQGIINYKLLEIPIFNRILYETKYQLHISIPNGICNHIENYENCVCCKTNHILGREKPHIKSMINNISSDMYTLKMVNTINIHDVGIYNVGGNLHCLLKNKYSTQI